MIKRVLILVLLTSSIALGQTYQKTTAIGFDSSITKPGAVAKYGWLYRGFDSKLYFRTLLGTYTIQNDGDTLSWDETKYSNDSRSHYWTGYDTMLAVLTLGDHNQVTAGAVRFENPMNGNGIWIIAPDTVTAIRTLYLPNRSGTLAVKEQISDTANVKVDTMWRVSGKDSIFFKIGGRLHAIKDSVGGAGSVDSVRASHISDSTKHFALNNGSGTLTLSKGGLGQTTFTPGEFLSYNGDDGWIESSGLTGSSFLAIHGKADSAIVSDSAKPLYRYESKAQYSTDSTTQRTYSDSRYSPKASPTFTGTITTPLGAGTVRSSAGGVLSSTASDTVGLGTSLFGKLGKGDSTIYASITQASNASNLSIGTVGTARLGSGVADATTFLAGDQTYKNIVYSGAASFDSLSVYASGVGSSQPVIKNTWYNNTNTSAPLMLLRKATGTFASPTLVLSGHTLGYLGFGGYGTAQWNNAGGSALGIAAIATENWGATNVMGAKLLFTTFTNNGGSGGTSKYMYMEQDGSLTNAQSITTPTINGGTAANDDITIQGTSSGTHASSWVILQPNDGRVVLGTSSPATDTTINLDVRGNRADQASVYITNMSTNASAYTALRLTEPTGGQPDQQKSVNFGYQPSTYSGAGMFTASSGTLSSGASATGGWAIYAQGTNVQYSGADPPIRFGGNKYNNSSTRGYEWARFTGRGYFGIRSTAPAYLFTVADKYGVDSLGVVKEYNDIATVSGGHPAEYATVDLTGQTAAKGTTTLYTPTASGMYRISIYLQVTTAATTSSILGGATGVVITYNDGDGNVAQSRTADLSTNAGAIATTSATNTTGTALEGTMIIYARTGVAIQYAIGYTSVGATPMAFAAHLKIEAL